MSPWDTLAMRTPWSASLVLMNAPSAMKLSWDRLA